MKQYLVSVWTRQSYSMWIPAESEEQAKEIAAEAYNSEEVIPDDNEEIDAIYVVDDEEVEDE